MTRRRMIVVVLVVIVAAGTGFGVHLLTRGASCPPAPTPANSPPQGEVCRVWLDGHSIDLSNSVANDQFPTPSPDGRTVVYLHQNGGFQFLAVDPNGGQPRAITPTFYGCCATADSQPVWSPSKNEFVAIAGNAQIVFAGPRVRARFVRTTYQGITASALGPEWSPDGRVVVVEDGDIHHGGVELISESGKRIRQVNGGNGPYTWSPTGLMALPDRLDVRVYDEQGRLRMRIPGRAYAWSPDGRSLATLVGNAIEIFTTAGRMKLRRSIPRLDAKDKDISWCGEPEAYVGGFPGYVKLDVQTGRVAPTRDLCRAWGTYGSPDGKLVARLQVPPDPPRLVVSRSDGSDARTLFQYPCADVVESDVQWMPDGQSLLVDFACNGPHY